MESVSSSFHSCIYLLITLASVSSAAVAPIHSLANGYALNASWWEPVTVRSQSVIIGARGSGGNASNGKSPDAQYKARVEPVDEKDGSQMPSNQSTLADAIGDGEDDQEEESPIPELTTLANNGTADATFIKWTPMRSGLLVASGSSAL